MKPVWQEDIDKMTHEQLAHSYRFAPSGDPLWQGPVGDYAMARFKELGGMTPALSKRIGLNP